LATVLAAPLVVASAQAGHDRDHARDGRGDRQREREFHGCGCGHVSVSSPDRPQWRRDRFSASRTLDLRFLLRMRNEGGDNHLVRFQVLTPKGHLYQEIQVANRPERGRRASHVSAQLPVAGTFISTSSLFGRWRVVPYLDDEPEPCGRGAVFTIVE
jgi:hypothetical protein